MCLYACLKLRFQESTEKPFSMTVNAKKNIQGQQELQELQLSQNPETGICKSVKYILNS